MAKSAIIVVAAIIGVYIGRTFNKYVKSFGTAIVGATMLVVGVSMYDKKMSVDEIPSKDDLKDKAMLGRYIGYSAGWIILTCLGTFIQLKFITADDCDDDDMMNKDYM